MADEPATPPATPAAAPERPAPAKAAPRQEESDDSEGGKFNVNAVTDQLINTRGGGFDGARQAVRKLVWDLQKQRVKNRQLRDRVVGDGEVILRGGDLESYNKMRALGMSVEQINAKLAEHANLQEQVKATKQERFIEEIASSLDIPNRRAFADLAKMKGLELEIRDVNEVEDGRTTVKKVPYTRLASNPAAEWKPLQGYIDEELGVFRAALYDADGDSSPDGNSPGAGNSNAREPRKATPMLPQSSANGRKATMSESDAVKQVVNSRYAHNAAKPVK